MGVSITSCCCSSFTLLLHIPKLVSSSSVSGSLPKTLSPITLNLGSISEERYWVSGGGKRRRKLVICFNTTSTIEEEEEGKEEVDNKDGGIQIPILKQNRKDSLTIAAACAVGLFTGVAVVVFNQAVHEIRDIFWDGIPLRGASWLREQVGIQDNWKRVILVPTCGGVVVSILNAVRSAPALQDQKQDQQQYQNAKAALRSLFKAVAASVTLGTGNSLGPEGPSVEIGSSIAKGVCNLLFSANQTMLPLSLIAAGSAAGISSGFNAAVAGCFFAVESVLWPSSLDSSPSLTNITSMVILSSVIASVVSQVGLGSEPAFKVPVYDFRSPTELPLYLLLGILCGLVSLTLSRCTASALMVVDNVHKEIGVPKSVFPVMGGLTVGLIALAYPEILYWGFENVDIVLESQPFAKDLPAYLLLQLVGVKILATSLCRASGLVGGYYAPSLFIGAATGMAYGKLASYVISLADPVFHFSFLEVASPQAYGLVGMAATLAGVCQVPLTAVLLLFELTQDYRIVLPLLGAVGLSSLIASGQTRKKDVEDKMTSGSKDGNDQERKRSFLNLGILSSQRSSFTAATSRSTDLCELESSLCLDDSLTELGRLQQRIFVSQAMRTRYVIVLMSTLLTEAITCMLAEKQSCALIVDNENFLIGLVTLGDIQEFCKLARSRSGLAEVKKLLVSEVCHMNDDRCRILWTASPDMNLLSVQNIMNTEGLDQLPVVLEQNKDHRIYPVGLIDRECINLTCRAVATREFLGP